MSATSNAEVLRDGQRTGVSAQSRARSRRWLQILLMLSVPLVIAIAGGWWYLTGGRYVSTDDAYVQANMTPISADVAGRLIEVPVRDNQVVKQGDLLLRLDDRSYKIAVESSAAKLAGVKLQIDALRATYRQKLTELKATEDTLAYQQRELNRQEQLLVSHVTPQAKYDEARHNVDTARQNVASTQQQIANTLASLGGDPNIATEKHPLVQQAQAALDQAKLDLSHTEVRAPANGIVTKVNKIPVGTYLNSASPAFSLVSTDRIWIEANFKETELTNMREGQEATVEVDTYPGTKFKARVESLSPGTGSEFSVLPPQNATGNWVKVVQRLPVRLVVEDIDPKHPLRAGMSVTAEVDTQHRHPLFLKIRSFFGS